MACLELCRYDEVWRSPPRIDLYRINVSAPYNRLIQMKVF